MGDYLVLGQYRHPHLDKIKLTIPVIGVEQVVSSLNHRESSNSLTSILADDMHYKEDINLETKSIDQCFANWFTQVVDNSCEQYYKLATALYQAFTKNATLGEEKELFSGLMYPSVASDITGVNIALEPIFVDNHLKLWQAIMYKVESIDLQNTYFCLQPIKDLSGIYKNGKLEWKSSDMKDRRLIFEPNTPTLHSDLPENYLNTMSVYK